MSTLPENAKIVFEWEFVDIYNRDQILFDGTTKLFQRVQRVPWGLCIPVVWDKILLAYQRQPMKEDRYFSHIGGNFNRWEDPEAGIKREFLEETWMTAKVCELRKHFVKGRIIVTDTYYYIMRDCTKIQEQMLDPGAEELLVKEVSFDEYIDLLIRGKCAWFGRREEVMLMKIDNKLEDFKRHLFVPHVEN